MYETTEAIVGAVTGTRAAPRTLLLGRYDTGGRLQYTGRTTTFTQAASNTIAGLLTRARSGHLWTGWSFSAGWGSGETLNVTLVEPDLVVEVRVDVARDNAGRWRHPIPLHRSRPDVSLGAVPQFGS
ncbi:ATP dependent DNA ligase [Streptomyces sp. NPDC004393]